MLRYTAPVDYLTLTEMAEAIGVKSTTALRRLCESGALKAEKKGKTWLVHVRDVETYKRRRKRGRPRKPSPAPAPTPPEEP
jgi:excisionase family DNA binding protein